MSIRKKLKYLDPFTYVDMGLEKVYPVKEKKTFTQEIVYDLVYVISAFVFAFIIYSIIGFALQTNSPMVIVMSASMQDVYFRGDIVALHGAEVSAVNAPLVELDESSIAIDSGSCSFIFFLE